MIVDGLIQKSRPRERVCGRMRRAPAQGLGLFGDAFQVLKPAKRGRSRPGRERDEDRFVRRPIDCAQELEEREPRFGEAIGARLAAFA